MEQEKCELILFFSGGFSFAFIVLLLLILLFSVLQHFNKRHGQSGFTTLFICCFGISK